MYTKPKPAKSLHTAKVVMRGKMRKTIIIAGIALCIICAALISYVFMKFTQRDAIPSRDLTLSDYPKLFMKEAVIVIGENAAQIEKESAEAIAANLENLTGNKPEIISSRKIESFKYTYNLIIIGTPKSNEVLKEVYGMTDAIRVTDGYPGEGKGILEILSNPWNEEKAMLLVEGSDEWGVKAGGETLVDTLTNKNYGKINLVKWDKEKSAPILIETKVKLIQKSEAIKIANNYMKQEGYKISGIPLIGNYWHVNQTLLIEPYEDYRLFNPFGPWDPMNRPSLEFEPTIRVNAKWNITNETSIWCVEYIQSRSKPKNYLENEWVCINAESGGIFGKISNYNLIKRSENICGIKY